MCIQRRRIEATFSCILVLIGFPEQYYNTLSIQPSRNYDSDSALPKVGEVDQIPQSS